MLGGQSMGCRSKLRHRPTWRARWGGTEGVNYQQQDSTVGENSLITTIINLE